MHQILSIVILIVGFSLVRQSDSSVIRTLNTTSTNSSLNSSLSYYDYLLPSYPTFTRPNSYSGYKYYYKILKLTVYTSDTYSLTSSSSSSLSLFGCLYETFFDPSYPLTNLLRYNDGSSHGGQFSMNYTLLNGNTYIFVVTTSSPTTTGSFTVKVSGSAVRSLESMTTTFRSGSLSANNNPKFSRSGGYSSTYYYDSYDVTVYTTGTYSFTSSSMSSTDLYGCLYQGSFDSSHSTWNLLTCDDDNAGNLQFLMRRNLYSSNKYQLVVTTSSPYQIGSYLVTIEGSSSVLLFKTTPNVNYFSIVPLISSIISLSVGLIILVIIILACKYRRQRIVPSQYNQNASTINNRSNYRSTDRANIHETPYTNPPSYNDFITTNKQ